MGTNSPGAIRYIGKYLTVACTLAMWNKIWNMGFESKLALWQYGFPRYKGKCLMVTGTTRYRRSWETIAKWYNVMHLLSLPHHVSHFRTGMYVWGLWYCLGWSIRGVNLGLWNRSIINLLWGTNLVFMQVSMVTQWSVVLIPGSPSITQATDTCLGNDCTYSMQWR